MPDLATLEARLTEAETAYHQLMTGSLSESVGSGDAQVRYTRADSGLLSAYIAQLRSQVAAAGGTSAGARRRAMTVTL